MTSAYLQAYFDGLDNKLTDWRIGGDAEAKTDWPVNPTLPQAEYVKLPRTYNKPTQRGFYWYKPPSGAWRPVEVFGGRVWYVSLVSGSSVCEVVYQEIDDAKGEWGSEIVCTYTL